MSEIGFQKKSLDGGGWVGGVSSIQFFLYFWNFFNFAKPLSDDTLKKYIYYSAIIIHNIL